MTRYALWSFYPTIGKWLRLTEPTADTTPIALRSCRWRLRWFKAGIVPSRELGLYLQVLGERAGAKQGPKKKPKTRIEITVKSAA